MQFRKSIFISLVFVCLVGLVSSAWSYEEMQVANGGAIKGKVTYTGLVPTRKIIPTKDQEVCGGIRDEQQVIVGPDSGVMDAIVYLKEVPKGKRWDKPKKTPTINNRKCNFEPHVQVMPAGMNLAILNSDPVLHNTHGFLIKATVFNVAMPKQGMRVERPIKKPGIVRVECDAHGWMLAWIYAADNPYYAMTGRDGSFTINDVPPGDYTMVVWQEYTGSMDVPVTVKAKETATVPVEIKK
jgi:Polysaccharide lyase family 4, domain II